MVIRKLYVSPQVRPSNDLPATLYTTQSSVGNESSFLVTLPQGEIHGLKDKTPNGNDFFIFKGIPYAKPPLGELRFKHAVELDVFPEDLDCTKDGNVSCQYDIFMTKLAIGSEDSLNVNVFTPKLLTRADDLMAVMVFFHGGGFLVGSNATNMYYPDYLVQEGVVVVTVNYRLGPLGFADFPGTDIDANCGLMDQQMALKWVNKNISMFGGNPKNVTIFGESAGGASVHYHYLNSESRKYFNRAIAQSGVTVNDWALKVNENGENFKKLAKILGCESESNEEIVAFMRKADPYEIAKHQQDVLTEKELKSEITFAFGPVIDEDGGFIPKSPIETIMEPNSLNLPLMFGMTSNEGLFTMFNLPNNIHKYEEELDRLVPQTVNCSDPEERLKLAKIIKEFYFGDKNIGEETMDILIDFMSDIYMNNGFYMVAELQSKYQHTSPTYFYQFSFCGALNVFKKLLNTTKYNGAAHADELYYMFSSSLLIPEKVPLDSKEDRIRSIMIKLWTNFAKFSNPTPEDEERSLPFKWSPLKPISIDSDFELDYLDIDDEACTMKVNPNEARVEFWKQIYAQYNGNHLNPIFQ